MRALTFHGKGRVQCDTVPDPQIEQGRDAIIRVTSCAICGSDLRIHDGTIRTGQTPVQRYLPLLLDHITEGRFDPSFVITHRGSLADGPDLYQAFRDKIDGCVKVVLQP